MGYICVRYVCGSKGYSVQSFWSEIGYRFWKIGLTSRVWFSHFSLEFGMLFQKKLLFHHFRSDHRQRPFKMSLTSVGCRNLIIGPVHMETGEVRYFTSSHATPGTRGEVQNAITRSLSTVYSVFVCFNEAAYLSLQ